MNYTPDEDLRVMSLNIMKRNIFRHHALLKLCEDYKPHIVNLVETGFNEREI